MKKNGSFKDFDPFADLFPATEEENVSKDPFSSSPVRKPISPRVRRASAASKGRKSSFKHDRRQSSFKDLVVETENLSTEETQEEAFDPFADLFPTATTTSTTQNVVAVSPRVRRASMNALSRRRQEVSDDDDDLKTSNGGGGVLPSPRTRTRNEYYRARQDYKKKKRFFYSNKNEVDTPRRRSMEKEALDAKRVLERAFNQMNLHNVENRDEFHEEFDMQGA